MSNIDEKEKMIKNNENSSDVEKMKDEEKKEEEIKKLFQ